MRVAVICSAHGYGHTGRQLAVVMRLRDLGHDVILYTAASPEWIASSVGTSRVEVRPWRVDVGIVQRDSLCEEPERTRIAWADAVAGIDRLADDLRGVDRAIVDIAPTALEACRRANVPAVAVGNFDWAWVYSHYSELADLAPQMRTWHAAHPAIALSPGPSLTGFASVREVRAPLALRAVPVRRRVAHKAVLVAFGGLGLDGLDAWLPELPGVTYVIAPPGPRLQRPDVLWVDDVPFASLLAGVDAVLTKPGYGVLSEAMLAGTRLCWVERGQFPEAPYLEAVMVARGDVKVRSGPDGMAPRVAEAVLAALSRPSPPPVASAAAENVVALALDAAFR